MSTELGLRERNKRDKLRRITRAAAELFERQGFEATTGRQICRRARIGTGTLFSYVKNKRELLFLIFREDAEQLLAEAPRRLAPGQSLVDALSDLFAPFLGFYGRNPSLSALYVRELVFRSEEGTEGMLNLNRELGACVEALLREGVESGALRPDLNLVMATTAVLAHYSFWVQAWLGVALVDRPAAQGALRGSFELMLQGMNRPSSGRPRHEN